MKAYLFDTHTFLWWSLEPEKLPDAVRITRAGHGGPVDPRVSRRGYGLGRLTGRDGVLEQIIRACPRDRGIDMKGRPPAFRLYNTPKRKSL